VKPKQSYAAASGAGYDQCQTPPHAVAPLLPFLPAGARIWEPAAGEGLLADALEQAGHPVMRSDWITGEDFFRWEPDPAAYDVLVTNPPYSVKYAWLRRCYELGKPFALLLPFETLASGTALALWRRYGWEELRLTQRVNFKMPGTGYANNGAQFPVVWLCWRLLPAPVVVADLPQPAPEHRLVRPKKAAEVTL
jgi:hypothetical protein